MIRRFVMGGRQVGKTRELLECMLDSEDLVYIAPTAKQAEQAFTDAAEIRRGDVGRPHWTDADYRRFRDRFQTWEQAADPMFYGTRRPPVLIDNVDQILEMLFGDIDTATSRPPLRFIHTYFEGNPHD